MEFYYLWKKTPGANNNRKSKVNEHEVGLTAFFIQVRIEDDDKVRSDESVIRVQTVTQARRKNKLQSRRHQQPLRWRLRDPRPSRRLRRTRPSARTKPVNVIAIRVIQTKVQHWAKIRHREWERAISKLPRSRTPIRGQSVVLRRQMHRQLATAHERLTEIIQMIAAARRSRTTTTRKHQAKERNGSTMWIMKATIRTEWRGKDQTWVDCYSIFMWQ